jgi:hypothetical protein
VRYAVVSSRNSFSVFGALPHLPQSQFVHLFSVLSPLGSKSLLEEFFRDLSLPPKFEKDDFSEQRSQIVVRDPKDVKCFQKVLL